MADQQPDPAVDILQAWLDRAGEAPACTVPRANRERPLPASHAQQGMWLAQQVAGDDDRSLTAPHAYRLTGPVNVDALAAALGAVLARHEALRTGFVVRQGELFQVVADPEPFRLVLEDVAGLAELNAALQEFSRLAFDLGRGPLLRARLFRLGAQEHVLVAVFHHIANDGWSMDVFHRELAALYDAATELPSVTDAKGLADVAELAEMALQYPDFAVWQRSLADDEAAHEKSLRYWREVLAGAPDLLALPTDRPRTALRSSSGDRIGFTVPPTLSAVVADLATARGTTPFAVQFAAFQTLLAAWSGQWDLVTGITTANRALPETEALIGFFVNVLPIRGVLSPEESFADLLVRTGRSLVDAYKRDEVPFELLLERLELPRAAGHNPLVQVTVASHQELTAPLSLSGLTVEHLPLRGLDVQEDLTFYLTSGAQGVRGDLAFRTDLFDRSTMEELGRSYLRLLQKSAAQPETALRRLAEEAAVPAGRAAAETSTDAPEAAGTTPRGVLEELIAIVWSDLLGCDSPPREANFFQVGGTSLAASRVANRLSDELGVRVPVRDVFRHSELAALAAHLTELIRKAAGSQAAATGSGPGGEGHA